MKIKFILIFIVFILIIYIIPTLIILDLTKYENICNKHNLTDFDYMTKIGNETLLKCCSERLNENKTDIIKECKYIKME